MPSYFVEKAATPWGRRAERRRRRQHALVAVALVVFAYLAVIGAKGLVS